MTAPDPALLDRVRKLLALAGSPNAHEAAAAAARAQALVARHQLEAWLEAIATCLTDDDSLSPGLRSAAGSALREAQATVAQEPAPGAAAS